jgi:hypothetical protein
MKIFRRYDETEPTKGFTVESVDDKDFHVCVYVRDHETRKNYHFHMNKVNEDTIRKEVFDERARLEAAKTMKTLEGKTFQ